MGYKIIGYYNHNNIGDDQYQITFPMLFEEKCEFIDADTIEKYQFDDNDVIIFGGGAVLNDYFVDKINLKFKDKPNKIIGLSIDLPFTDILLKTNKLDRIDYMYIRNYQDYNLFSKFYNKNKIEYLPDTSCLLKNQINFISSRKTLGIVLCNNIYNDFIISFIKKCKGYKINFISFNLIEDVRTYKQLNEILKDTNIEYEIIFNEDPQKIFREVDKCDLLISMRFHGCLFAYHNKVPFIPLLNTRKVICLVKDLNWEYVSWDSNFQFDENQFYKSFNKLLTTPKINYINYTIDIPKFRQSFKKCLSNKEKYVTTNVLYYKQDTKDLPYETAVKYISYLISNNTNSKYNYGLLEKMSKPNFNFINEVSWIIDDYYKENILEPNQLSNPNGKYCLTFKNQNDLSGIHRSGWKYVYDNLFPGQNDNADLLLDMYLDETFLWNSDIYSLLGIIPYTQKWIGFVHHTFDETFSDYNCKSILNNDKFILSLKFCKGIITLSEYLKDQLEKHLLVLGLCVPIYCIYHPTEEPKIKFDMNKYIKNNNKRLVNIGTWLRNIYFFYGLDVYEKNERLFCSKNIKKYNKAVLTGKESSNYFPSDTFLEDFKKFLEHEQTREYTCQLFSSRHPQLRNNWYLHLLNDITDKIQSVEKIDYLSSDEFDNLMSQNVVFIRLVDCSAVNTLIECVVRNTPVVVNSHPAVVEILGPKYPLYFNDTNNLYLNNVKILDAHKYLVKLDKSKLKIETFMRKFKTVLENVN